MQAQTMLTLKGKGNRRGCAVGKTEFLRRKEFFAASPAGDTQREQARLHTAISRAREELLSMYRELVLSAGESEAWMFLLQIYLLDGSLFSSAPISYVYEGKSAEEALFISRRCFFSDSERFPFFSSVSEDVCDVFFRVLRHLCREDQPFLPRENCVLLCGSPLTTEIFQLRDRISGIVAPIKWESTNAAALARSLFIPTVFTDAEIDENVASKSAIIDSNNGIVQIDPNVEALEAFSKSQKATSKTKKRRYALPLLAHTSSLLEASRLCDTEFIGIGLFRSEDIYLSLCKEVDEEALLDAYRSLAESLFPRPLVIKSLTAPCSPHVNKLTAEKSEPKVFVFCNKTLKNQLRAILRASVFTTVALAVPSGKSYAELAKIKDLLPTLCEELSNEGKDHRSVPLGIIIDTPAAALTADTLADVSDFFIIKRSALSFDDDGDLTLAAENILLRSALTAAKKKKKQVLLLLDKNTDPHLVANAKKLGVSALVIPPDELYNFCE